MNQLIVAIAALLLLIAFPVQALFDSAFDARQSVFDSIVRTSAEKARMAGCFTSEIIDDMKSELCANLPGLSPGDITVVATTSIKYRGDDAGDDSKIDFAISMPMNNRFVGGLVFGNVLPGNTLEHTCAGKVYSEAIP